MCLCLPNYIPVKIKLYTWKYQRLLVVLGLLTEITSSFFTFSYSFTMSYSQRKSRETTSRAYPKHTKHREAEQYSTASSEVDVPEAKPKYQNWDIRSRTSYKTQPTQPTPTNPTLTPTLKKKSMLTYHLFLHYENLNLLLMVDTDLNTIVTPDEAVALHL